MIELVLCRNTEQCEVWCEVVSRQTTQRGHQAAKHTGKKLKHGI